MILQSISEEQENELFAVVFIWMAVGTGRQLLVNLWQNSPLLQSDTELHPTLGGELVDAKCTVRFGRHMLKKTWQYCPSEQSEFTLQTRAFDALVSAATVVWMLGIFMQVARNG